VISLCAQGFDSKDPRLFSMATPKMGASAYKRVFDPTNGVCPRPKRIVQDVHKVVHACKEIYKVKGVFVPGLAGGRVAGHRHTRTSEKTSNNHGGKRTRLEYNFALDEKTMHEDLKDLLDGSEDLQAHFRLDVEDAEGHGDVDGNGEQQRSE
jgi:hypothetical protein